MDATQQQEEKPPVGAKSTTVKVEVTQQQQETHQSTTGLSTTDEAHQPGIGDSATVPAPAPIAAPQAAGGRTSNMAFDISSYDPLQAHAYQLTESAGLGVPVATTTSGPPAPPGPPTASVGHGYPRAEQQPQQPLAQQTTVAQNTIAQPQQVSASAPTTIMGIPASAGTTQQLVYTMPGAPPGTTFVTTAPGPGAPGAQQAQYFLTDASGTPILSQTIQLAAGQTLEHIQSGAGGAPTVLIQSTPATIGSATAKRPLATIAGGSATSSEPGQKRQQLVSTAAAPSPLMAIPLMNTAPAPLAPQIAGAPRAPLTPFEATSDSDVGPLNRPQPDLSQMTADERRRHERNLREQQRSFKISQQIKELKTVLTESNIPFKPNKFSILLSTSEYIKQLQSRAIMLDTEHKKLVATIRQTNDMVNSGQTPTAESADEASNPGNNSDMLFVQGLDYKAVFEQASAALTVAALDGRILECNREFEDLSGLRKKELARQSLFTLLKNHEAVFQAMGEMLDTGEEIPETFAKEEPTPPQPIKYYSGIVVQKNDTSLRMNITLSRSQDGYPRYFNCAMTAAT